MEIIGNKKSTLLIVALVVLVALGGGLSFLSLALLLRVMAPMEMLAVRWTYAALLFLFLALIGKVDIRLKGKSPWFLLLAGLAEPCAYAIFEAYGIKLTSTSMSAIFIATCPTATLIMGLLFFKRKTDIKTVLSIAVAFIGVAIATVFSPTFSMSGTKIGILCMFMAVLTAGIYSHSSAKASENFSPTTVTAYMAFEAAIFFDIICLFQGYSPRSLLLPFTDWNVMVNILFLSGFCSFAFYYCYNKLLSMVDTALASNASGSLITVVGVLAGILVAGDTWGWYTIVGMIVTLTGVWLSTRRMSELE